jgi:xylulokinase
MTEYLLAHDAGTTGVKSTLFKVDGTIEAAAFAAYPTSWSEGGIAEQNPEDWWQAVQKACQELNSLAPEAMAQVCAVGLSAMMNGCALIDDDGMPIRPALIHADARSEPQCKRIADALGDDSIYTVTGSRMAPYFTAGKLAWLVENEPHNVERARWCVQTKDFIAARLTGVWGFTDPSDASLTACCNISTDSWYAPIIELAGFPTRLLPEIVPSTQVLGTITAQASRLTGIPQGAKVVVGAGDGACATAGAGAVARGDQYHYLGGTSWVATVTDGFVPDPNRRVCAFRTINPGQCVVYGTVQSAGSSVDWAVNTFFNGSFEQMEAAAASARCGCDGLIFLPYLSGERSPIWDPLAKGVFCGLTHAHGLPEMARAVFEGVAMALAQNLDAIDSVVAANSSRPLHALGGGMRSPLWRAILAAAYNRDLQLMVRLSESTSCGAAMAAAVGAGVCSDIQEAAGRFAPTGERVSRDSAWSSTLKQQSSRFSALYTGLKPYFGGSTDPQKEEIEQLTARIASLELLAATDELTGLQNRRAFYARLRTECLRSQRYGHPLTLGMIDIDGLKTVNDSQGHLAGDALLKRTAALISASIRAVDSAARLGGDEFALLFPETDADGARAALNRLHVALDAEGIPVSIGLAHYAPMGGEPEEQAVERLLNAADSAMYASKQSRDAQV